MNWPALALDQLPLGIAIIDQYKLVMANPAALRMLGLSVSAVGQALALDGPDGPLVDRLGEIAAESKTTFDYRLSPAKSQERLLHIEFTLLNEHQFLLRLGEYTPEARQDQEKTRDQQVKASHVLKTPLAILTTGLSSLINYYDRYTDSERRDLLNDMLREVQTITGLLSKKRPGDEPPGNAD
jgi:hypothetical protein